MSTENLFESIEPATNLIAEPRNNFFLEAKALIKLFLPLLLSQITYAISLFAAILMVGHLGKDALAALALVSSIYSALCAFFYGIFVSISVLVSQNFGAKNDKNIQLIVSQGFVLAVICSIPFIIIMWHVPFILSWTGQNPKAILLSIPYLHALSFSIFPWLIQVVMEQFLIGLSLTRLVFLISLIQVPAEILVTYVFIFGKFGFPAIGISGIGYGFTLILLLTIILIAVLITRLNVTKKYSIFSYLGRINKQFLLRLFQLGVPIGATNLIEYLLFPTLVLLIGRFGADALAAHQITRQYFDLAITIGLALAQATVVRVGQAVGSKNASAVQLSAYVSLITGVSLMLIIALLYSIFAKNLIAFDIDITQIQNNHVVFLAKNLLIIVAIFQIFDCIRLIAMASLRGMEDTKIPMYITLFIYWLIGLTLSYFLGFILDLEVIGVWYGMLAAMIIGSLVILFRLRLFLQKI